MENKMETKLMMTEASRLASNINPTDTVRQSVIINVSDSQMELSKQSIEQMIMSRMNDLGIDIVGVNEEIKVITLEHIVSAFEEFTIERDVKQKLTKYKMKLTIQGEK